MRILAALALVTACTSRPPEDVTDWNLDPGSAQDVEETIAFTDEPYDFPSSGSGIDALYTSVFPVADYVTAYAPGDAFDDGNCESEEDADLPIEIEGIVTIHPKLYLKTDGCGGEGDEKYYGNFFLQDATDGVFVLGDTKVAHFSVGNKIKIRVRGARTAFDLDEVYAWDLVEVDYTVHPIYYETKFAPPLDFEDLSQVRRITGVVATEKDTFGLFYVDPDPDDDTSCIDSPTSCFGVQLDIELNRRGVEYPVGTEIQVTGPILYSYSEFSIVVMNLGQIEQL